MAMVHWSWQWLWSGQPGFIFHWVHYDSALTLLTSSSSLSSWCVCIIIVSDVVMHCIDVFKSISQSVLIHAYRAVHTYTYNTAKSHWVSSKTETIECWSFVCMEEGILLRKLAFSCGHGNTQEEYAVKRKIQWTLSKYNLSFLTMAVAVTVLLS